MPATPRGSALVPASRLRPGGAAPRPSNGPLRVESASPRGSWAHPGRRTGTKHSRPPFPEQAGGHGEPTLCPHPPPPLRAHSRPRPGAAHAPSAPAASPSPRWGRSGDVSSGGHYTVRSEERQRCRSRSAPGRPLPAPARPDASRPPPLWGARIAGARGAVRQQQPVRRRRRRGRAGWRRRSSPRSSTSGWSSSTSASSCPRGRWRASARRWGARGGGRRRGRQGAAGGGGAARPGGRGASGGPGAWRGPAGGAGREPGPGEPRPLGCAGASAPPPACSAPPKMAPRPRWILGRDPRETPSVKMLKSAPQSVGYYNEKKSLW